MKVKTNFEGKDITITLTKEQLEEIAKQTNNITKVEDINSYEDACKILNKRIRLREEFVEDYEWYNEQLYTIIKAVNFIDNDYKEWKPDFTNNKEYKYIPYWERGSSDWGLISVDYDSCCSVASVSFYYKKENTSRLISNKFINLYNNYLG